MIDRWGVASSDSQLTCTSYLEQVVFLEFLEDTALDLNKLIRDQKSEKRVVVRVDGDIQ